MKSSTTPGTAIELENDLAKGITGLAADAARVAKLHDGIAPSTMGTMFELNKTFERMVDPFGFRRFGLNNIIERAGLASFVNPRMSELTAATKLHDQFAGVSRLVEAHEMFSSMAVAATPWREMTRLSETFGMGNAFASQLSRMSRLDRELGGLLGMRAHDAWSAHLKGLAVPSVSFLRHDWPSPVALLAELATSDLGASVSWLARHRDQPLVMTAALLSELETIDGPAVVTEGDPICGICGGPMVSLGETLKWHGPRRGTRHRRLFPACSKCMESERDNPGFLLERLERLTQPILYAIKGGGRGDGAPAGVLRLVRVETDVGDDS